MTMERLALRFSRHFSNQYKISPLKKVLRKIASPLPMAPAIHEKEGFSNAPR